MSLKVRSILVLVIGTVLGLTVSISSSMLAEREQAPVSTFDALEDDSLALLTEAIARVRNEYVDQIDEETLVENAIRGMLEGLDQHSRYLDNRQYEDIRIATTGTYTGVGLDVDIRDGKLTVIAAVDNAPAAKAGILAGDIVVSVDDVPVGDNGLEAAVNRMRGRPGTEVRLGVSRGANEDLFNFSLTRTAIRVQTVRSEYLAGGFGYIRVSGFSDSTLAELETAASSLTQGGERTLSGVVLDLRDNPGGVLDAAIGVADQFLEGGLIVRGDGRIRQARFEQYASPGDPFESVPLAVLINRGSASGSEIVAGALKDHGRADLIGQRSYGKGSVQSVVPLGAGSAIKLTTAHYFTPSGTTINGLGIEPDVTVRPSDARRQYGGTDDAVTIAEDPQLEHALKSLGYEAIALSQAE
ncbi:MAG TPA: S41 family peptidase [Gammaproteobacteria bacterium]|nr:S41 family peptidase [Gammaproteobacteria bacterium]